MPILKTLTSELFLVTLAAYGIPAAMSVIGIYVGMTAGVKRRLLILAVVLLNIIGFLAIFSSEKKKEWDHERDKADLKQLESQEKGGYNQILNQLASEKPKPATRTPTADQHEQDRRKMVLEILSNEYRLGRPNITAVPKDWIDFRLKALGEDWSTPGYSAPTLPDIHIRPGCGAGEELKAGDYIAVHLPEDSRLKFTCNLQIYNANAIALKGAVLRMWMVHSLVTLSASPPLTQIPLDSSFSAGFGYELKIDRTLVANNDFFMVDLEGIEPSAKRYVIKFRIITEDGRILDFGSIAVIPSHDTG